MEIARKFLGKQVEVTIDRPIGSKHPKHGFVYEVNYGYVEGIKAPDGEDLDAYYLGTELPVEKISGTCVAIVHRVGNDDDKLVVVRSGQTFSDEEILQKVHFQEQWFKTEVVRK